MAAAAEPHDGGRRARRCSSPAPTSLAIGDGTSSHRQPGEVKGPQAGLLERGADKFPGNDATSAAPRPRTLRRARRRRRRRGCAVDERRRHTAVQQDGTGTTRTRSRSRSGRQGDGASPSDSPVFGNGHAPCSCARCSTPALTSGDETARPNPDVAWRGGRVWHRRARARRGIPRKPPPQQRRRARKSQRPRAPFVAVAGTQRLTTAAS